MRISVSAAVFCVLFALQVSQVQASLGPVQHDGIKMPAGVSTPKSIGFSEIYGNASGIGARRSTLDIIPWFLCVSSTTDSENLLAAPYYTSCGALYEETNKFCELSKDWDYCYSDSNYCSGGSKAAQNTVIFSAGNYCFASEEDCCELNAGLVAGIVIGCTVGLTLLIVACAWCCKCCCFKRKVQPAQPGVVMMQPAYVMPK